MTEKIVVEGEVTLKELVQESIARLWDEANHIRELMHKESTSNSEALRLASVMYEIRRNNLVDQVNGIEKMLEVIDHWKSTVEGAANEGRNTARAALAVTIIVGVITSTGTIIGIIIALRK